MSDLFLFPTAQRHDPAVEDWFFDAGHPLRLMVRPWFQQMRGLGPDVRELLHDGCPTACVGEAAFAYVNAFKAHAAVGFFQGATLPDPAGLLEGQGKRMRHVKLMPNLTVTYGQLETLIAAAYRDILTSFS